MNHDSYNDSYIRGILNTVKTVAMVGVSPKISRPSYFVFKYLLERGYRVIPVNPGQVGTELNGQKFYARLADIEENEKGPNAASRRSALNCSENRDQALALGAFSFARTCEAKFHSAGLRLITPLAL